MVQPGLGGALDTPRTNIGDATYLNRQPDFADISQEASFQSPAKDGDLLQQLRNGRSHGINFRTPRPRGPLADRRNLPPSIGGTEFTPLLKSLTRNSAQKRGKENGLQTFNTPGLDRIDENDLTPLPAINASAFLESRNQSYLENTLPQVESSSVASTPLAMRQRRGGGGGDKGPLQDGNQLSLREQENVIDRIEKENFGLKLKIHFLEEALRKAGPGFSEAALKENTDLKVDKVTMQRELQRYKKYVTTAERDLDTYRQQMLELQERARLKQNDNSQSLEVQHLQKTLREKEADAEDLRRRFDQTSRDKDLIEKLRVDIEDLQADLRDKDRQITERDDELDKLGHKAAVAQERADEAQRRGSELEKASERNEELEEARDTVQDLELSIRRLEEQLDELRDTASEATAQKKRAERDLEELQEKMANKSMTTKGLSRQVEEKVLRLQAEIDKSGREYAELERELARVNEEHNQVRTELEEMRNEHEAMKLAERSTSSRAQELETELLAVADERDDLQARHNALIADSDVLREEAHKLEEEIENLQQNASKVRDYALEVERDLRQQYQDEIERLNDEISNLQAEVRERDNLYDNDSEKWENEKHALMSDLRKAEEKASGLQRTIDRLLQAEGNLSNKESALQKAMESEMRSSQVAEGLRAQLNDVEVQKVVLEEALKEARKQADAVTAQNSEAIRRYEHKLNKAEQERDTAMAQLNNIEVQKVMLEEALEEAREQADAVNGEAMRRLEHKLDKAERERDAAMAQLNDAEVQKVVLEEALEQAREQADAVAAQNGEAMRHLEHKLDKAEQKRDTAMAQLNDVEVQKVVLEEVLEEAREQADIVAAQNSEAMRRLKHELDKAERERDAAMASQSEHSKQGRHLRKSKAEVENLESDVRQQQEVIDRSAAAEAVLRRKLERARSERAAFRMSAEKLQRDMQQQQQQRQRQQRHQTSTTEDGHAVASAAARRHGVDNGALDTLVRAAERAEERHKKETKGMVMQMEWMQARWERESLLRSDAAFAKNFIQLQLQVAQACNKAQLRELEHIRTHLLHNKKPLSSAMAAPPGNVLSGKAKTTSIRPFLTMARFIARLRIASRAWSHHEKTRLTLVSARDEQRRRKKSRQFEVVRLSG